MIHELLAEHHELSPKQLRHYLGPAAHEHENTFYTWLSQQQTKPYCPFEKSPRYGHYRLKNPTPDYMIPSSLKCKSSSKRWDPFLIERVCSLGKSRRFTLLEIVTRLRDQGHSISEQTVAKILSDAGLNRLTRRNLPADEHIEVNFDYYVELLVAQKRCSPKAAERILREMIEDLRP